MIKSILTFFETNAEPFDKQETLVVLAIRDAILKGVNAPYGELISVDSRF